MKHAATNVRIHGKRRSAGAVYARVPACQCITPEKPFTGELTDEHADVDCPPCMKVLGLMGSEHTSDAPQESK